MQQYKELLNLVLSKGIKKEPARSGMPSTISYFGHQFRHDLSKGFPLLTLRPISWKGVVTELLWFLRGDTNIKYLDENGVDFMWHQDAYNYYCKMFKTTEFESAYMYSFEEFCDLIKTSVNARKPLCFIDNYNLGDCGYQYGKLWRDFNGIDQITELILGLKLNPEGRRHMITALKPDSYNDMALFTCHNIVQFNCRKIKRQERLDLLSNSIETSENIPEYYLDCQFYQRSADLILGVPYNTASYALLTHILAKICNMIPGDLIHTFGDVHIYENHFNAANELIERESKELPKLEFDDCINAWYNTFEKNSNFDYLINFTKPSDFKIKNYDPHTKLISETKLSTGLI